MYLCLLRAEEKVGIFCIEIQKKENLNRAGKAARLGRRTICAPGCLDADCLFTIADISAIALVVERNSVCRNFRQCFACESARLVSATCFATRLVSVYGNCLHLARLCFHRSNFLNTLLLFR